MLNTVDFVEVHPPHHKEENNCGDEQNASCNPSQETPNERLFGESLDNFGNFVFRSFEYSDEQKSERQKRRKSPGTKNTETEISKSLSPGNPGAFGGHVSIYIQDNLSNNKIPSK